MSLLDKNKNVKNLRVIKTARSIKKINKAAKKGFIPLVKALEPSKEIKSKFSVYQHIETGEIEVTVDARYGYRFEKDANYKTVIERFFHYQYNFKSPFAAYLIPKDIQVGEHVFLKDLIEDFVGVSWNQGVNYRLASCEAIWNGTDFEIQYDPAVNKSRIMG